MRNSIFLLLLAIGPLLMYSSAKAQMDTTEYMISIKREKVNIAGKEVMGMTINGGIPGPVLRFTEGEYAVIYVKNEMEVETSIHWHGLLLPNFYDGVPYLTTPPIEPGHTQKYEFPLVQAGTYWYHSHTMLQEQSGVYGAFIIEPMEKIFEYNHELVLVLSDWTNQKPMNVLRFLKRGTEWYNIRKGTATPLNRVIARGAFGAQLNFWKQRMEGADIADIYYDSFLINGKQNSEYPDFEPGENVRLRIINGAASTSFWMTFGGEDPRLISADGLDAVPVKKNKTFIGVAETYDFMVKIPEEGRIEFRTMAQDGSGTSSAYLGAGKTLAAPMLKRPDKIGMMKQMASMKMRMGAPGLKYRPGKDEPYKMKENWGMQMSDHMNMQRMKGMDLPGEGQKMKVTDHMGMTNMPMNDSTQKVQNQSHDMHDTANMDMTVEGEMDGMDMSMEETNSMTEMNMFSEYNYDYLKSPEKTTYADSLPVREILLNLTGNMQRYIWSMNGIPISETDKIKIKGGEVTRITFNNLTMMHHPMHLHGHFFRVINANGEYSPLKHTVNVPPMQQMTIEFYGDEYGDWFFHCHILYHMMGGMARVFSYDTPRDTRMEGYPVSKLIHETNQYYSWGMLDAASQMTAINLITSNIRNQFNLGVEYGYNQNIEAEFTFERYLYDYFRVFGGVNIENPVSDDFNNLKTIAVAGFRFLTPYLFSLDVRVDHELRPRIGIGRSIMLFPKFSVFGYYEYQADFGFVNSLEDNTNFSKEIVWNAGAEYLLSRNLSLMGNYDNRFGGGGGLSLRF